MTYKKAVHVRPFVPSEIKSVEVFYLSVRTSSGRVEIPKEILEHMLRSYNGPDLTVDGKVYLNNVKNKKTIVRFAKSGDSEEEIRTRKPKKLKPKNITGRKFRFISGEDDVNS